MFQQWILRLYIFLQYRVIFVFSCLALHPVILPTRQQCNSTNSLNNIVADSKEPTVTIKDKRNIFLLPVKGYHLSDCAYTEKHAGCIIDCAHLCLRENGKCLSINYKQRQINEEERRCQLNNSTKEKHREKFTKVSAFDYLEPKQMVNGELVSMSFSNEHRVHKGCRELYQEGKRSNSIYTIDPDDKGSFSVTCDMESPGEGWTVFQRRFNGSVDFNQNWTDYKHGFGNLSNEFWLGLDRIHRMTTDKENILRIEIEDFEGEKRYAEYRPFQILNECEQYKLVIGNYSGDAGNSLGYHDNMRFSTKDVDNDAFIQIHCSRLYRGGWWYSSCYKSNLNGYYYDRNQTARFDGIIWWHWKGYQESLKAVEMKFRPISL